MKERDIIMRVVESAVGDIRRKIFTEVARLAFEGGDYARIEELPYRIIPGEVAKYRESVFLERAIVGERLRLAIGLPLRSASEHAPLSDGLSESAISEKYYDPPLVNIVKFACHSCPDRFFVTDGCQGCLAHPCVDSCPKMAICLDPDRKAHIDQAKCIKCGRCDKVCSYNAIIRQKRPCAAACGVDAIEDDELGRADINYDKCVSCGMCIVNCPFGAISDKGQIFQMIHAMTQGDKLIAILAPAFVGQFGPDVTPEKLKSALQLVGFHDVKEVAVGADLCTVDEAAGFLEKVPEKQPFMATSCCPSWSVMAKKEFPQFAHCVSMALTPMVLTARMASQEYPGCKIVFIGPCAAKKLEASRRSVRSQVDFVLTFEELMGIFEAKGIEPRLVEGAAPLNEGSGAGRGFAVSGGVADAVVGAINRIDPGREVKVAYADGLKECKEMMRRTAAGQYNGYLLEGMACPGGCVAGTGTRISTQKGTAMVNRYKKDAAIQEAMDSGHLSQMHMLKDDPDFRAD